MEINILEENIEVIEEGEDLNYELVYSELMNMNDSSQKNKNTKIEILSQNRASLCQSRSK